MLALTAYSYYEDLTGSEICIVTEGCSLVRHSAYSTILGIKVSLFGLIASIALLALFLNKKHKVAKNLFPILAYIGSLFAIYFISVQLFVIKAICSTCLIVDIVVIIIAALVFYNQKRR